MENDHKTINSVTVFLIYKDEYLFIERHSKKDIHPNLLNGVGGRVTPGENFADTAIREIKEETGIEVNSENFSFCGIFDVENPYSHDWFIVYFKIRVPSKKLPVGFSCDEGNLVWLNKNKVLEKKEILVDDLHYCFPDIVNNNPFFVKAKRDSDGKFEYVNYKKLKQH